jgi:hypothetical protein
MAQQAEKKVLVQADRLIDPSGVTPIVFIGLGGAGCKVVARVAEQLRKRPDFEERYKSLNKFAFIDTNINDLERYRKYSDSLQLISDFEKADYSTLASGKSYLEPDDYFTQWNFPGYKFRAGDTAGAGQIRVESRLGVYYQMKHGQLLAGLRKLFADVKEHSHGHRKMEPGVIRIVIAYSIAGGTGSGSHLPMAYAVRDLCKEFAKPELIGVAVMPSVFAEKVGANKDGIYANGYAALKETEHLMKLGAPEALAYPKDGVEFHYYPADPSRTHVKDKPFEFLYVVDLPKSYHISEVEKAAGDGLYQQFFTSLFGEQAGDYDNFTQHQRALVPHDFAEKGMRGYTSFYGTFGAATLHVPTDSIVGYVSRAAAVGLLDELFLDEVPAGEEYRLVSREEFQRVKIVEEGNKESVKTKADIMKEKDEGRRRAFSDALFEHQIRLLADSEHEGAAFATFHEARRFGEHPETIKVGTKFEKKPVAWKQYPRKPESDSESLMVYASKKLAFAEPATDPTAFGLGLVQRFCTPAFQSFSVGFEAEKCTLEEARNAVNQAANDVKERARKNLIAFFDSEILGKKLVNFEPSVGPVARRYALVQLLPVIGAMADACPKTPPPATSHGGEAKDGKHEKPIKTESEEFQSAVSAATSEAFANVARTVAIEAKAQLEALTAEISAWLTASFDIQKTAGALAKSFVKDTDAQMTHGGEAANRFILDVEALQMESGVRLWNFYYMDVFAEDRDFSLKNKLVSKAVAELYGSSQPGKVEKFLEHLADKLKDLARRKIEGDPLSADDATRKGLTLPKALELEIVYRNLYLSNSAEGVDLSSVSGESAGRVRALLQEYRHGVVKYNSDDIRSRDQEYIRDKFMRAITEKAGLLGYVDEKHLNLGGVRPDRQMLMLVSESVRDSEIIRGAFGRLRNPPKQVWEGCSDHRQIVFYQYMLNVPVFVFARLREMKSFYQRFQASKFRSKVLHIEHKWENSLPDLDPEQIEHEHKQSLVRAQAVDFAALLVSPALGAETKAEPNFIHRRDNAFVLRDPEGGSRDEDVVLGETLQDAMRQLPVVLEEQSVRFAAYGRFFREVRRGNAPSVLKAVVELPARWKGLGQSLSTRFAKRLEADKLLMIEDYNQASEQLQLALRDLAESLQDILAELKAEGDESALNVVVNGESVGGGKVTLKESAAIVEQKLREWDQPEAHKPMPNTLKGLFGSMGGAEQARAANAVSMPKS